MDRADHRGISAGARVTSGHTKLADAPQLAAAPRVLHVIAPAAFGGLEQVVFQLATGRVARGLPTEVLVLMAEGSGTPPIVEMLADSGVQTSVLRSARRAYHQEYRAIQAATVAFEADVVHTHGYHPDLLAGRLPRMAGRGLVSTAHGFTGGSIKNRTYEWLQRRVWRRFDVVAAVSSPLHDRLIRSGVPESVLEFCPNAWSGTEPLNRASARERLGLPPSDRLVGWVGRLSGEKGPDVMIRALAHLPPEIGVVMIGAGPEQGTLIQLADELGVSARINWTGPVKGAGSCMAAFDAFALSSRTEGTPMVLLEAMAARTPIVATAVGGVPDVATSKEAILVSSEAPEELAAALAQVFSAAGAAVARATAARRRLDDTYALGPWLARYEQFYSRAAERF